MNAQLSNLLSFSKTNLYIKILLAVIFGGNVALAVPISLSHSQWKNINAIALAI